MADNWRARISWWRTCSWLSLSSLQPGCRASCAECVSFRSALFPCSPSCGTRWSVLFYYLSAGPTQWVFAFHLRHFSFHFDFIFNFEKCFVWIISGIRRFIQDLEKEAQIYERQRFGPGTPVSGSAIFSCFSQLFTSCSFVRGRINLASRQRCWPIIGGWRRGARETVQ